MNSEYGTLFYLVTVYGFYLVSFALTHQSKNRAEDSKSLTPAKPTSRHRANNLAMTPADSIINLQRTVGNQAVQRLVGSNNNNNAAGFEFARIGIQPKLKISQPEDAYEQEADRVAKQVMRLSALQDSAIAVGTEKGEGIDRKCAACEMKENEEKIKISRKPYSESHLETNDHTMAEINSIRSSNGASLDSRTREFMGSRFGYDFGSVRIHTGERAARSANDVNAPAHTVGNDVDFGQGLYEPNTLKGRKLLAHELTHVIQQHGSRLSSHVSLYGREGLSISRQTTLPPPDTTLRDRLRSQAEMFRRIYSEQRYGCWCGPGHVCDEVRDDIDSCCKQHDLDYESLAVTSGPSSATAINMWSSEGLKRTMNADLRLVACTQATKFDLNFYGPAAALYREGVALIFGGRAAIARLLLQFPSISW